MNAPFTPPVPPRSANAIAAQDDFDVEPIPGLPEALPPGEHVLWSGVPDWRAVLIDVFHVRALAIYAAILLSWRVLAAASDGASALSIAASAGTLAAVFAFAFALLTLLAIATAKTTRYTITNHRVVMRIGVALTMSINLPFKQITGADYREGPFGTGGIALSLAESGKLGYAVLWPHARPFRFSKPQPMMRGVADGAKVAACLANALRAEHAGIEAPALRVTAGTADKPQTTAATPVPA